jgi:superfamily II DNA/RNA helicase
MGFEEKFKRLMEILNQFNENDKVLVFSNRRCSTEKISNFLRKNGFPNGRLSSDSTQATREKVLFQQNENTLIKLSLGLAHPVITKADNSTSDD